MTSAGSAATEAEESARDGGPPEMTASEYALWREAVRRRTSLDFPPSRLRVLKRALWTRMRAVAAATCTQYYHRLHFGSEREREWTALVDLLVNNETSFFRHPGSFQALVQTALPQLLDAKRRRGERRVRLWSAGCSLGHEAYSLAIACLQAAAGRADGAEWEFDVLATDLGEDVLRRAAEGRFKPTQLRGLSDPLLRRWFAPVGEERRAADELRRMVRFERLNLAEPGDFAGRSADVVFCQNVLIYFTNGDRQAVVERLCGRLEPGGFLFLGPAEFVDRGLAGVELLRLPGALVYQRAAQL